MSLIKKINQDAATLTEADLDWIVTGLLAHLAPRINFYASKAFGEYNNQVARKAFEEHAKKELYSASSTYLFKLKHWQDSSRSFEAYLLKTLERLSNKIYWENQNTKKANLLICPACREYGCREFLIQEGKFWRCGQCSKETERLPDELNSPKNQNDKVLLAALQAKLKLHSIFSLHSRKGYRCPDCEKFLPESANGKFGVACPYEDCWFFGSLENLEEMTHPLGMGVRLMVSLQENISKSGDESFCRQDFFKTENIDADVQMSVHERSHEELQTLLQVIDDQLSQIKKMNSPGTMIQKTLMYEAYRSMIYKFPEEMISYLVHEKKTSEFPIQARLFQEYVGLLEGYLPFTLERHGETFDIFELDDPNLILFDGTSEFEAVVDDYYSIPNLTKEVFIGSKTGKQYGPCFIGKLLEVMNLVTGESLMSQVEEYSFVSVKMKKEVEIGTKVKVKHFRIPSHYEMKGLVFLQRIRKSVVDKVYFRLNKKRRPLKNGKAA